MPRSGVVIALGWVLSGSAFASVALAQQLSPGTTTEAALQVSLAEMAPVDLDLGRADPVLEAHLPTPRPADTPDSQSPFAPIRSLRPRLRETWAIPRLRWDDHPRGTRWTMAVMGALRSQGAPLLDVVPRDIAAWCPAYPEAAPAQRAAFWAGLVSTLAWHESTHDPRAVGGGGQWFGLVQIAPGTARWRNCAVQTGEALLDGPANLSCGITIMAATVPRDGVITEGMRGVAADWGPFHSSRKREDMRTWLRSQDYCLPRTRPVARPDGWDAAGPPRIMAANTPRPVQRPIVPGPPTGAATVQTAAAMIASVR